MPIILRAILTGFGYKIGAELGRYVVERVGLKARKAPKEAEADLPPEGAVPEGDKDASADED